MTDRLTQLRTAIAQNTVPGGSAYGRAAAEVILLSLEAQPGGDVHTVVEDAARWLVETKPSMTSMRTVAAMALAAASGAEPRHAVVTQMRDFIAESRALEGGQVRILHGKGTGALRDAIRQELKATRSVKSFADAVPYEGGHGVTVVELRD